MKNESANGTIASILENITELVPVYMKDEADRSITNGNVAVVIIEENGNVTGKIFGSDKIRGRDCFRVAWTKASQVWITGMKTGEYERKVFNDEIPDRAHGISMPDLIGWMGGQPITLKNGTKLSFGFSGFRGTTDIEIVVKAVAKTDV